MDNGAPRSQIFDGFKPGSGQARDSRYGCDTGHSNCGSHLPHSRSARATFTPDEVQEYFQFINLPQDYLSSPVTQDASLAQKVDHGLPFLTALMRHHLSAIPFENLNLHYSSSREMTLDSGELFQQMIRNRRGRGGYCFQMNALFGTILRSIGYKVISCASRVNTACQAVAKNPGFQGPSFNCWDHMINIVCMSSKEYLIDVGMNARGPVLPIELRDGIECESISPRRVRLIFGCLPEHTSCHPSNSHWQLEIKNTPEGPWVPTYAFSTTEFLPADFEMMNWYTSTHKRSWFTHKVMIGKMLLDESRSNIIGDRTLYEDVMRQRIHGEVQLEVKCKSEHHRVEILEKYFGVQLSDRETAAIRGTMSEIP